MSKQHYYIEGKIKHKATGKEVPILVTACGVQSGIYVLKIDKGEFLKELKNYDSEDFCFRCLKLSQLNKRRDND